MRTATDQSSSRQVLDRGRAQRHSPFLAQSCRICTTEPARQLIGLPLARFLTGDVLNGEKERSAAKATVESLNELVKPQTITAFERRGGKIQGCKDSHLQAKARTWP